MFARAGGVVVMVLVVLMLVVSSAWAGFAIEPGSFRMSATNRDGTSDTRAGSHPFEFTVAFAIKQKVPGEPEGDARDVEVDLPPGLVGDPLAVPRCPRKSFEGQQAFCPGDTQIGVLHAEVEGVLGVLRVPVFNLVPPPGVPARVGASAASFNALEDASVRTGAGYGVAVTANNIPTQHVISAVENIWGVPADKAHDPERQCSFKEGEVIHGCPSGVPARPFLTLPTSCTGPLAAMLRGDSVEAPAFPYPLLGETFSVDAGDNPIGLSDCEEVPFSAELGLVPDTARAESPSGVSAELKIPQPESPEGIAESNLKEAVVSLPEGMTVSPSAANGLAACPLEGPEGIDLKSSTPAKCPDASKVGTVEVQTPVLEHPLKGSVFLAQQGDLTGNGSNPFGSLLAIYVVAEGEGVLAKIPGEIELDKATGRVTARFGGVKDSVTGEEFLPQLPYSDLKMSFFGGPRAPLMTPASCGTYTTTSQLAPWSATPTVTSSSSFGVLSGPGAGSPCPAGAFAPSLIAGTSNNQAGAHSPLSVTFSRQDGEQRFGEVQVTEPPGLLATLKNVAQCPEPQASQGECSPQSEIGETTVAAGPGEDPFWVKGGKVYLTGPYAGAPFGLSIVVPAIAGPFNLGTNGKPVIVRARIGVDSHTAQAIVTSDPLPTMLKGVPLDLRTINVTVNRQGFIFNPTNCSPLATTALITSTTTAKTTVSSPFEAANCASLPYKPSLTISTQAHTSKANGASLLFKITTKEGQANTAKVKLTFPKQLPARLTTLQKACTDTQFNANPAGCPAGSVIGAATVHTPILTNTLTGPIYLVSHGGVAFPDAVLVLQGEGITIYLDGNTNIKKGITSSTFNSVPDAPFTTFEATLPEGPHSAFTTNIPTTAKNNLCTQKLTLPTTFTSQNNATLTQNTKIKTTNCHKTNQNKKKKKKTKH